MIRGSSGERPFPQQILPDPHNKYLLWFDIFIADAAASAAILLLPLAGYSMHAYQSIIVWDSQNICLLARSPAIRKTIEFNFATHIEWKVAI